MSLEGVQFVIGKAVVDSAFRQRLKEDPEYIAGRVKARYEYDLTDEEVAGLTTMDWDGLQEVGHDLDQRVSRMRTSSLMAGDDPQPTCACTNESNPDK
ncbi:MAG: Os1348 family NHLP clan protein [Acidimicrobiia bacterium]